MTELELYTRMAYLAIGIIIGAGLTGVVLGACILDLHAALRRALPPPQEPQTIINLEK